MLTLERVSRHFGGLRAIDQLSLTIATGDFVGVIGPNGAGKTTLLNLITGYQTPTEGTIAFDGQPIQGLPPFKICRLGIARTFQVVRPFAEMSVEDNVMTGALFSGTRRLGLAEARARAQLPLEMTGLWDRRDSLAGALTIGQKKKLELARALAVQPKMLLLDEVMGGLAQFEVEDMIAVLARVHAGGTTVIMIEHVLEAIMRLARHVVVINFGKMLFEGSPADVMSHPEVVEAYIGRPLEEADG